MKVMVGETRSHRLLGRLHARGWGRMFVVSRPTPFEGEPWGLDNGAFVCWRRGVPFDEARFLRHVEAALSNPTTPYLAVLPDVVGGGRMSLDLSLEWLERLPAALPWYLAVQNGMQSDDVAPHLPRVAGLFLGGDDTFKATAPEWSRLAHEHGRLFHYARASTPSKVRAAFEADADSLDSSFPLWTRERWAAFEDVITSLESQTTMPWSRRGDGEAAAPARTPRALCGFLNPNRAHVDDVGGSPNVDPRQPSLPWSDGGAS